MHLALYKGPAPGLLHKIGHWAVCTFTGSPYSHCELVIDGACWTASSRDGGVRRKVINLQSGHWDVVPITGDVESALAWFRAHEGQPYDWAGVLRFGLPFLPQGRRQWFCSEAVAASLGLPRSHSFTPQSLADHLTAQA
jgi:hypothetical protein